MSLPRKKSKTHRKWYVMKGNISPSDARDVFSRGKMLSLDQSALPGQTISTCPTLEPCTIESAGLSPAKRKKMSG